MIARSRSFSVLYSIQRTLVTVFYLISVLSLFWLIFYLLNEVWQVRGVMILLAALAYLIIVVIVYSLIHVITYIPANLAGAFDPLKNDIASGKIRNAEELAGRLASFLTTFFNFAFFDVKASRVDIQGHHATSSEADGDVPDSIDPSAIEKKLRESDACTLVGRLTMAHYRGYLYVIPLIFGGERLGYMAVITRQRLWGIFRQLLSEFENDFVDDQVVHVLAREN